MAQAKIVVNVTDKHGNPMIGLEVELVDTGTFTPANHDPIEHVVAIETTDISGTATFTGLTPSMYYARPRITRPDIRIQTMMASGIGILCYSAVVDPNGRGTHTTIQSAIDALGLTGGTVLICAGTYQENLTIAGDTENLWLIGISRNCVTIQGTAASPTLTVDAAGTGPVLNFRLEHLTLDHTGSETLLYFNSTGGGQPTKVDLHDLRFLSGAMGIDLSNASGGTKFSLRDLLFESTCVAAGQLQVSDLHVSSCKLYCSGNGLYVAGSSAATGIRIEGCLFGGGGSYCLRIGNATDVQVSNCRFLSLGVATAGILASHGLGELVVDGCIIDCVDGIGIDLSNAVGTAIVISNCSLTCSSGQATAREGISVAGYCVRVSISDCHISGFESFGIRLKTLIATGAQHFVLDGNIIRNGEDTHSISIGGWDYGTVTGCVLIGAGGANTTYGVYGVAGTTYVVIVGNVEQDHDGMTNLTNGVDGNVIGSNTGGSGSGMGPSPHVAVTLDANADTLLSLSTQELGLDTQLANLVFAGPDAGDAAVPTFRALVDADIPAAIARDAEVATAISDHAGDDDAHHALVTLAADADVLLNLTGQVLGFDTQAANLVLAGPAAGGDADPTFRSLVVADIPDISAVYIAKAFMAAKGDLIGASANDTPLILSVGADGHVLTADSGEATGLKWAAGGGGGTPTLIEDADQDTKIQCEEGADEDKLRFDTAGTERMQIDDAGFVAIGGTPSPMFGVRIQKTPTLDGSRSMLDIISTSIPEAVADGAALVGVSGTAVIGNTDGYTSVKIRGLSFQAGFMHIPGGVASIAEATGVRVQLYGGAVSAAMTIDLARGFHVEVPFFVGGCGKTFTTAVGFDLDDITAGLAACTDVYGIRIADFSVGTNRHFLELGDTPYLRLLAPGSWDGVASETPLYLACDAGPALQQVTIGAADSGGAGFRVLRVPN